MESNRPEDVEDVREHEEEGRERATEAEARRAEAEREAETPPDTGGAGGLANEADEERRGVMRPPAGAGPDDA